MRARKRNVDLVSIIRANTFAKNYNDSILERADNLKNDPEKKERLEQNLCTTCHYVNNTRVGGATMTTVACGICETDTTFSNTCVDVICPDCADKNNLCKHCGADMKLINKRNRKIIK